MSKLKNMLTQPPPINTTSMPIDLNSKCKAVNVVNIDDKSENNLGTENEMDNADMLKMQLII